MAINKTIEGLTLKLQFDGGVIEGKQKIHSKSFNQIKTNAEDESILKVGNGISSLQANPLLKIQKIVTTTLIEE